MLCFGVITSLAAIPCVGVLFTGLACVAVAVVSLVGVLLFLNTGVVIFVNLCVVLPGCLILLGLLLAVCTLACLVVSCVVGLFLIAGMVKMAFTGAVATAEFGWGGMRVCFRPLPWVAGQVFSAMGVCVAMAVAATVSFVLVWIWVGRGMLTWVRWGVRACVGGFLGAVAQV